MYIYAENAFGKPVYSKIEYIFPLLFINIIILLPSSNALRYKIIIKITSQVFIKK
jgi:hypothetical protein